ncbi:MAG: hypothetical protein BalsKO_07240 [Balneolaceae bacterium]
MILCSAEAQEFSLHTTFYPSSISIKAEANKKELPNPKAVLRRSLIVPGWGQITNKQVWKVPLVYGLLGGLVYYSIDLTKQYHDYRAAYYNSFEANTDLRFGSTPDYLVGANINSIRSNRNFLRNRRDFIYVTIGLAYILNAVDAYVFAHLRSFDVSDDLSMNTSIRPNLIAVNAFGTIPAVSLSFSLSNKK